MYYAGADRGTFNGTDCLGTWVFSEGVLAGQGVGIVAWMVNWVVGSKIYLLLYMKVWGKSMGFFPFGPLRIPRSWEHTVSKRKVLWSIQRP